MGLSISNYKFGASNTGVPAYAQVVMIDIASGTLTVGVWFSADDASAGITPNERFTVTFGSTLSNGHVVATLAQLSASALSLQQANQALDPVSALRSAWSTELSNHPKLAGASIVS